jgi:ATP-dependent Clp protease protease subunit
MTDEQQVGSSQEEMQQGSIPLIAQGCFLFTYPVTSQTIRPVIEWILTENLSEQRREFLQLFINSPGGIVKDSFALTDVMEASAVPIRTTGIGMIASCGLLIFMAGQKGYRTITPNTAILSHQFSANAMGKEHELIASQRQWELVSKRIITHYRRHTKLSIARIRKELMPAEDKWLTAQEAVKYNLADKVKKLGR